MKIALYAHGGSGNHGCEALVRSTIKVLGNHDYKLISECVEEDLTYGLEKLAEIQNSQQQLRTGLHRLVYSIRMKLSHDDRIYYREVYRDFAKNLDNCDLALAIGGDNYCYKGFTERFSVLNDMLVKQGTPTVLWGCSIDPERINATMLHDLQKYSLITARESITYQALKDKGLSNVHLVPDTAFCLDKKMLPMPKGMKENNIVGINVSPLVIRQERMPGITIDNYRQLIKHILSDTSFTILLIPHVVWKSNDDRQPLRQLFDEFEHTGRLAIVDDCNAEELKGYICRCRFLIAARTHASIAGYSTGVPTLVVGYSVKAKGIACDLFGDHSHYVTDISSLNNANMLSDAFQWIAMHEEDIRQRYKVHLTQYVSPLDNIAGLLQETCKP